LLIAALVHPDNQVLGFLAYNPVDALGAVELADGEFLLVFNTLGVFVDVQGRKSRDREIMYPAVPQAVAVCDRRLLVYSETHIDVFDTDTGDWVQSINIRRTRPLLKTGQLNLSMLQEMPHLTFLSNIHKGILYANIIIFWLFWLVNSMTLLGLFVITSREITREIE
jgi:serine/threonine-protein kinase MRCK